MRCEIFVAELLMELNNGPSEPVMSELTWNIITAAMAQALIPDQTTWDPWWTICIVTGTSASTCFSPVSIAPPVLDARYNISNCTASFPSLFSSCPCSFSQPKLTPLSSSSPYSFLYLAPFCLPSSSSLFVRYTVIISLYFTGHQVETSLLHKNKFMFFFQELYF